MIAVILPSRGLVFSQTIEELLAELSDYEHKILWSHGRPIPECFEIPTQEAIKGDFTHVLIVEEDMAIPRGTLKQMFDMDKDVVAADYPVREGVNCAKRLTEDTALYSGCGFLLIKTEVLRKLPSPIWRSDIKWLSRGNQFTAKQSNKIGYGRQDINFGIRLYLNDIKLHIGPHIGHRRLIQRGEVDSNNGFHEIKELWEMTPVESGKVEIVVPEDLRGWFYINSQNIPVRKTELGPKMLFR